MDCPYRGMPLHEDGAKTNEAHVKCAGSCCCPSRAWLLAAAVPSGCWVLLCPRALLVLLLLLPIFCKRSGCLLYYSHTVCALLCSGVLVPAGVINEYGEVEPQPELLVVYLAKFVNQRLPMLPAAWQPANSAQTRSQQIARGMLWAQHNMLQRIQDSKLKAWEQLKSYAEPVKAVISRQTQQQQQQQPQSLLQTRWALMNNSFSRKLSMMLGKDTLLHQAHDNESFHPRHSSIGGYLQKVAHSSPHKGCHGSNNA